MSADSSQTDLYAVVDWKMRRSLTINPSARPHSVHSYEDIDFCNNDAPVFPTMFTHDCVQDDGYTCIDIDDACLPQSPPSIIPPHLPINRIVSTVSDEADLPK